MYRGSGPPAFRWNKQLWQLPRVLRNERKEKFEPLSKVYENIDEELIPGDPRFRFQAEYKFAPMSSSLVDVLVTIYNRGGTIRWIPHSDFSVVAYDAIIEDISPEPKDGLSVIDQVHLKIKSKKPVKKIPTVDNMLGCVLLTRVCLINNTV